DHVSSNRAGTSCSAHTRTPSKEHPNQLYSASQDVRLSEFWRLFGSVRLSGVLRFSGPSKG
ncbi:MAG: hypothetical protein QGG25_17570, partial [Phycisphaerae bacterium]|nr:hypothetical protein [Phycisphaerae bacterium]